MWRKNPVFARGCVSTIFVVAPAYGGAETAMNEAFLLAVILVMAGAHVGHDSVVGSHCVFANYATLVSSASDGAVTLSRYESA